jgi:SAM-dependent methyltransferase
MRLSALQRVWEDWAQADPLWAILSDPAKSQRRWDRDEFFATGRDEIRTVMRSLTDRGICVRRHRCLDFGCGVGRLTQGLGEFFEICDGVDISPTMIQEAKKNNMHPDRCFFWLNDQADLKMFPSKSFDLIYSNIVLQHIQPDISERYVKEFVRLLVDGGIAVFQVPSKLIGPPAAQRLPEGAHHASLALAGAVPAMAADGHTVIRCEVRNESGLQWPRGSRLALGNHWRKPDGSLVVLDDGRAPLTDRLDSGGANVLALPVRVPQAPGSYVLEVDVVEEGVCWFADRGSVPLRLPVVVKPAARRHRLFAGRGVQPAHTAPAGPALFSMYALPRDRVIAAVEDCGGRLVDIESYNPAGEEWESYRYYVSTARTGTGSGR